MGLVTDQRVKIFLHIVANSQRNSRMCIDSALCGIARSQFFSSNLIEYLREYESILKTALAHESGDPGVAFNEKTKGRKSRETVSLINFCSYNFFIASSAVIYRS
jgi:hypothetical protein